MQTTHISLLEKLSGECDAGAWQEFCGRYGELIRGFARQQGMQASDCDDVLQDVLLSLTKAMPGFRYDPAKGRFRGYLKTVAARAIFARLRQKRGERALEEVGSEVGSVGDEQVEAQWDAQWRQYHLRRAMSVVESEFNDSDRRAFARYAVMGERAEDVAAGVGLSVEQVYQAKSRMMKRLAAQIQMQVEDEG